VVDCVWNVTAHAQKPDFVFRRNGRDHLNRRGGGHFSRLLAAEVCASAVVMVVMLDTPCSEVVWKVLATHSIRQFLLHFPSRASTCAIAFQLGSNCASWCNIKNLFIWPIECKPTYVFFFFVVIAITNSRFTNQFNRSVIIMDTDYVFCEAGNLCFVCDSDNVGVHRVKCVLLLFSPFVK
jgi:hypothetical protein